MGLCFDTQLLAEEVVRENEKEQDKTIPMMTEEILQIFIRLRIGIDT